MTLEELFSKTVFLLGAGASLEAECLTSPQILTNLKLQIEELDKPQSNGSPKEYKKFKKDFRDIYDFIIASLNYHYTLKDPNYSGKSYLNIEDYVMLLRQIIDREFIVPYPLVGNWNDKIMKWDMAYTNINIFEEFLKFITTLLQQEWTNANVRKAKKLLKPLNNLLSSAENFKANFFSLNYDLVFEKTFESNKEKKIELGFEHKTINETEVKIWNEYSFEDSIAKLNYYKLHGSINWFYDNVNEIIYEAEDYMSNSNPLIIFGSSNKMNSFDPFLFFLSKFRMSLKESNLIIVIGYSFHDKYINNLLIQQLMQYDDKKMLIIDPKNKAKDLESLKKTFIDELQYIQNLKSVNDIINFKQLNQERIEIIPLKAGQFYMEYLLNDAEKLKEEFKKITEDEQMF